MDEIDEKVPETYATTVMAIATVTLDILNSLIFLLTINQVISSNLQPQWK